jgi:hypothetical protein
MQVMKSRGFGDDLEKVFEKTGVKKIVEKITKGKDCGCNDRRDALNRSFPYQK